MVLKRQYRHLREELAKLKVPDGLEDLDAPFNPNVTLPAMGENAGNNNTNTNAAAVLAAKKPGDNSLNQASNNSSASVVAETESSAGAEHKSVESLNSALCSGGAPLAPLEINTNQPYMNCAMDDESDSPAVLPQTTLPTVATANVVKVDDETVSNEMDDNAEREDGDGEDVILTEGDVLNASEFNGSIVGDLMEQLFFESSESTMHYDD